MGGLVNVMRRLNKGCMLDTLTDSSLTSAGPGSRSIQFSCDSDGGIYEDEQFSGLVFKETWKGICANTEYECRLNKTSGETPTGAAVDAWLATSADRTWSLAALSATLAFVGTFQIRRKGASNALKTVDANWNVIAS